MVIEDFRSIRGSQRISLDAPVVLIHGPNGTGKTSLLSAIEFALTGNVASLARFDPGHIQHLPQSRPRPSPQPRCLPRSRMRCRSRRSISRLPPDPAHCF
ncbi:ATP-binding protein [Paracoccus sp. AS002]|uniref:AAA family ATPase n=1 Tax=Paracoccus sp. AS002 TaxID=3019545 RepID=UPI0023E88C1F|nr:ATP-binding protein [Paracoccus sp. AS002]MDF3907270.1 ATP-binding protein [Paracoccus sp. AS002]